MRNELMIVLVGKLVRHLQSLRIAEYMEILERPTTLILLNIPDSGGFITKIIQIIKLKHET